MRRRPRKPFSMLSCSLPCLKTKMLCLSVCRATNISGKRCAVRHTYSFAHAHDQVRDQFAVGNYATAARCSRMEDMTLEYSWGPRLPCSKPPCSKARTRVGWHPFRFLCDGGSREARPGRIAEIASIRLFGRHLVLRRWSVRRKVMKQALIHATVWEERVTQ